MKKLLMIVSCLLIVTVFSSCVNDKKDVITNENGIIVFEGKYEADDQSTLTITQIDDKFHIKIDITRLTSIDDGIGETSSKNKIKFGATDAMENPIHGEIFWKNQDIVKLKFTNSTWDYLPNGTIFEFCRVDDNGQDINGNAEAKIEEDDSPYVAISFGILDSTFRGYKNQTGATFFEQSNQNAVAPYYIKKLEGIQYYYGTNEVVIGVSNDEICLMTCFASDVVGHTSPRVRELINSLNAESLFEVYPAVIEVNNSYNSKWFFYWKINNGYIGVVTIGGNDPMNCYDYVVNSFVLFDDLDMMNSIDYEKDSNIKGDSNPEIKIAFAPKDYYSNPEKYETYLFDGLEYGADVVLVPGTQVNNFKFFRLDSEKYIMENKCEISEELYSKDKMTNSKPFVVRIYIAGPGGPYYGISYNDINGDEKQFVILESGEDGSFFLDEL